MANRRTTPKPNADLERLAQNLNANMEALRQGFESLRHDVLLVQKDVRFEAQQRQALASDLQNLATHVSQLRDTVQLERTGTIEQTAKAAAQETLPVVQKAVKRAQRPMNWKAWGVFIIAVFAGIATVAEKAPAAIGLIERTWDALKG